MNSAHLHLLLNHAPVLGTIFGAGLLVFAVWKKSQEETKAALGFLVVAGLLTVPAYLTGEPAEGVVGSLPGVSQSVIEQHEEAATIAFVAVAVLGVGALIGLVLFRKGKAVPLWFGYVVLAASLLVGGLMAWTANLGGQVRHTEIRSGVNVSGGVGASGSR